MADNTQYETKYLTPEEQTSIYTGSMLEFSNSLLKHCSKNCGIFQDYKNDQNVQCMTDCAIKMSGVREQFMAHFTSELATLPYNDTPMPKVRRKKQE